jgi:hypothetical protein
MVLVKFVLEAILVYWMSLSWIPNGTLEKLRHTCFIFLWAGTTCHFFLPLVKWNILAIPKALGGWGNEKYSIILPSPCCKGQIEANYNRQCMDKGSYTEIYQSRHSGGMDP